MKKIIQKAFIINKEELLNNLKEEFLKREKFLKVI